MAWLTTFSLGILGYELELVAQMVNIGFDFKNVELTQRNLAGDMKWSYLKQNVPVIMLQCARLPMDTLSKLLGFFQTRELLNLKCNDAFKCWNQQEVATDTTHVTLTNTGASGITINGVYLRTDVLKSGTNYYSGGSTFVEATRLITLATPLPSANEQVQVDFSFLGHKVRVSRCNPMPHQGASKDFWQAQIELMGV